MAMASGKKTVLLLITVFVAPILLGTLMFLNAERLGISTETVNYGNLIDPVISLHVNGVNQGDTKADIEVLVRNKWTLLYFVPAHCDATCQAKQALMKRIRLLTNEDMRRIQIVSIYQSAPENTEQLANDYPTMLIGTVNSEAEAFTQQFPKYGEQAIYVIDPLGNLMMFYVGDALDIKRIMKDFKRILKYSQIG